MSNHADPSSSDYYARLGVRPSASPEQIQTAYRKRARETHPDRNPDDPDAVERFQKVKEAYQVLRDPERRSQYDEARSARQRLPDGLTINQQAPAGCGGYVWRVLAGMLAFGLFLVLEVLDVWAAESTWTIVLAVGAASVGAGIVAVVVAHQFPDEATDVMLRLTDDQILMRADGKTIFRIDWADVREVWLREDGYMIVIDVPSVVTRGVRVTPPVLTQLEQRSDHARLHLDVSDTDVPRDVLLSFLRKTPAIPFPRPSMDASPRS